MSSAAMASSSVSQEDAEHDFEKFSRRTRIRIARGRDVRCPQSSVTTACRLAESVAEADDAAGEMRHIDSSAYLAEHDSLKQATRPKDKRLLGRPGHIPKGKPQRDRRKLREKRRSAGVMHMPSTESTGGSTNDDDPELSLDGGGGTARCQQLTESPPGGVNGATARPALRGSPLRNKSLSDLDADDEDNQDCDSLGRSDSTVNLTPGQGQQGESVVDGTDTTAPLDSAIQLQQVRAENSRLSSALLERDARITRLEIVVEDMQRSQRHLRAENDKLAADLRRLSTSQ